MNSCTTKPRTEQECIQADLISRKNHLVDLVERNAKAIQEAIKSDDMVRVANLMASTTEAMQYYEQFTRAAFSNTAPSKDNFLEIQTVFSNSYLINPDYIVALAPAEGELGSKIRLTNSSPKSNVWDEYYTFIPYVEMKDRISECYECIRKTWGKAKQEVNKIKKEKKA